MADITYSVCVDFDSVEWSATPDFTTSGDDITADVKSIRIDRGYDREEGSSPAATAEIILENSAGNYYPTLSTGDYYGKIRIWLPVQIKATHNEVEYDLYRGFISRIQCSPHWEDKTAYFYCTDGTDLLAKIIVTQDMDTKTAKTDGAAIEEVLDACGWSATLRDIDVDGGDIIDMPATTEW